MAGTRLGICTGYWRHESAYAAIALATLAETLDADVSLFDVSPKQTDLQSPWDHRRLYWRDTPFTEWVTTLDRLFWTYPPNAAQSEWVKFEVPRVRTGAMPLWHAVWHGCREELQPIDYLFSPHRVGAEFFARFACLSSSVMPFDVGTLITRKPFRAVLSPVRVLFPLFDGNCRRMEMTAFEVADRALATFPDVHFTFLGNSGTLASRAKRRIDCMCKTYPGRAYRRRLESFSAYPAICAAHDLTYWPTHYENLALAGLCSVQAGTPVLCFDVPPLGEILPPTSAVRVPAPLGRTGSGAAVCLGDYNAMERSLHLLLRERSRIQALHATVADGLLTRREQFHRKFATWLA